MMISIHPKFIHSIRGCLQHETRASMIWKMIPNGMGCHILNGNAKRERMVTSDLTSMIMMMDFSQLLMKQLKMGPFQA